MRLWPASLSAFESRRPGRPTGLHSRSLFSLSRGTSHVRCSC
ncbi:MAG TPA: hypothetical protein DCP19_15805 [Pseudomonas sp.]|nr:hypothetical protein [Pseudomonas sp.]